jgi:lysozyme
MNPAIPLIKEFEGCKLKAYKCPADVWTIGYGHTDGVKEGDEITQQEADRLLASDVELFTTGVQRLVSSDISRNQLGALVSFAYNVGLGNLRHSTLLRMVNAGDFVGAANQFLRWNKAGGKVLAGLTRRREAEKQLFLKDDDVT